MGTKMGSNHGIKRRFPVPRVRSETGRSRFAAKAAFLSLLSLVLSYISTSPPPTFPPPPIHRVATPSPHPS